MPRKTLNYQEITDVAQDNIKMFAKYAFEGDHVYGADAEKRVLGIQTLWSTLVHKLDMKEDDHAGQKRHADWNKLNTLFTDTLEKLRQEVEQTHSQPDTK